MPDTTPTPADNLRAAAELLRDKATAAVHEGRTTWSTGYTLGSRSPVVVDDQEHPSVLIETFAARLERVNSYLALVGPATGLVVADWLDAAAAGYNATVQGAASVWTDPADATERDAWVARQTDQHALAVARQVLGATDQQPASAPAAPADRATDRRRLTPNEHDRAWHAIEGSAGEDGADPGTVLNAVLHALRIDPPTAEEEQAASPSRRLADEAQPTETDDGDPICGDRYDDETCELEPEHAGAHCAGTLCWDYGRAPATAATEEPQP